MITIELPNTTPYNYLSANACKLLGPSLPEVVVTQENNICICDFLTCEYNEKTFAKPGGEYWENDKNEFLFKRLVAADTVAIELYKDNIKVADLNTNAYGTFFNGFPAGTSEQQLYVGYLLDWELVFTAFGAGQYQVKAQLNIIGVSSTFESRKFFLVFYSDVAAHKTVRIESTQNGNIFGNEFDFTGLNWYQSLRIPGEFGNPTPVYEENRYKTERKTFRQIKETMSREWALVTKKINWEVAEKLIYNKLLANEILITDYNIYAESIWRRVPVFPDSLEKTPLADNPDKIYNIKFVDSSDIFTKRNF